MRGQLRLGRCSSRVAGALAGCGAAPPLAAVGQRAPATRSDDRDAAAGRRRRCPTARGCRTAWPTPRATPSCRTSRRASRCAADHARRAGARRRRRAARALGYPDRRRRGAARPTAGIATELANRLGADARRVHETAPRWTRAVAAAAPRAGARMKLRLYHHPDGARVAYREAGTGPALVLLHSALLSHREFEPIVEPLVGPLPRRAAATCRCTATPRTARAIPTRPDWLAEVIAALLPRGRRAAAARRRPRPRRARSCCARRSTLRPRAAAARADAQPPAPRRRAGPSRAVARRGARAAALPGLDRALAHGARARVPARARGQAVGARRPGRARPRAPRVRRRRRQRQPRALVGAVRRALAGAARGASCSTPTRASTARCCCCGPTQDRLPPAAGAPRRRSTCCPTPSCACSSDTGFLIAYDDPVGVARELAAFLV